jgi:AraC-like DNA-binding protein
MLLFLSISGIFLSALLFAYNFRKNPSTLYLAILFFSISIYCFLQYVVLYSKSVVLVGIFFFNIGFITYLIGPALYWYTRSLLTDNSRLKKRDIWHLLPTIVFLIVSLPHLFSSWSHKMEIANKIVENGNYVVFSNYHQFHGFIPDILIFLSRPLLSFGYLLWSVLLLARFYKLKRESRIFPHQVFVIKWLIVLFSFLSILIISHAIQIIESKTINNVIVFYLTDILQLLSVIGLIGLLISPFFFPSILYGLPLVPSKELNKSSDDEELKKNELSFETDYLEIIEKVVESSMREAKPYIHAECNIAYFAKIVKVPAHHLAYYFKEVKKQSFNDYRNAWRVNHAKDLIKQGKTDEYTFEAIGMLSGFSSKNTFFTAFKKMEGITPGAYAEQVNS